MASDNQQLADTFLLLHSALTQLGTIIHNVRPGTYVMAMGFADDLMQLAQQLERTRGTVTQELINQGLETMLSAIRAMQIYLADTQLEVPPRRIAPRPSSRRHGPY